MLGLNIIQEHQDIINDFDKNDFTIGQLVTKYKYKERTIKTIIGAHYRRLKPRESELSEEILRRDNHTCQMCRKLSSKLHIHHIDQNKSNNCTENLVTLCPKCHLSIHGDHFQKYIKILKIRHKIL